MTDASDPAIRALMKLPASLADLGLAALVGVRPARPAAVGRRRRRSAILLHPAVIDVSAWWGQYESIYVARRRSRRPARRAAGDAPAGRGARSPSRS